MDVKKGTNHCLKNGGLCYYLKRRKLNSSGSKTMSWQIKKDGRPEKQYQCGPEIFSALITELTGKNVFQYYEYQTYVDE